jgi:hypothetical protein
MAATLAESGSRVMPISHTSRIGVTWAGDCPAGCGNREVAVRFTASKLLVVIALVLFVLAAFNVALPLGGIDLLALGLAFLAASFIVP